MYYRLLLWTLFMCALGAWSPAAEQNLINNAGFEDGMNGWQGVTKVVTDETAAHSGQNCMMGELLERMRICKLVLEVDLSSEKVYKLAFWLRSPDRCSAKVVLVNEGEKPIEVTEVGRAKKTWTRYEALFSPRRSGPQALWFGVPAIRRPGDLRGKMYIDDIELTEMPTAGPATNLTHGEGYNDFPTMAADRNNQIWVAWISFSDGRESLKVKRLEGNETQQVLSGVKHDGYVGRPWLASGKDGLWLVWAMEVKRNWDIYGCFLGQDKQPEVVRLTKDPATDVRPTAAVDNEGRLHVAWESNRDGSRDVFAVIYQDGRKGETCRLSEGDSDDCAPALCIDAKGRVHVAWESFRNHTYDIFMKTYANGTWSDERQLTKNSTFDTEPYLVAHGGDVWMAWNNSWCARYAFSGRVAKRACVAKITSEGLKSPVNIPSDTMFFKYAELGRLDFDREGRPWVTVRRARNQRGDWDVWLQCYSGETWSAPILASGVHDGVCRPAPTAAADGKVFVVWQSDDRPNRPQRIGYRGPEHSDIFLARLDGRSIAPGAEALKLVPFELPDVSFPLAEYRKRFKEDSADRLQIEYDGKPLTLYWGDFHEHTEVSQCNARGDMALDRNLAELRDIGAEDFGCVTDHGQDMNAYDWHLTHKAVSQTLDPKRFVTFLAEEWAGSPINVLNQGKTGTYGHRNIIFADDRFPRWFDPVDGTPPDELWRILKGVNQITIPHQLADGESSTDWRYVDEKNQPVAEIFQGRGSYEYNGTPRLAKRIKEGHFLQDVWESGTIIGVIASPDHPGGYGKAGVFAPELTREAILDAVRKRHTYGTTAAKILLDFRLNGKLMGEVVSAKEGEPVELTVKVKGAGKIKQVEVCKDNRFVHTVTPDGDTAKFTFVDTQPRKERSFYYIRVIQDDGEIAWSSPVWVEQR